MKKLLKALLLVLLTVCLCVPFAACGDTNETQVERKRIVGIDSDKTYLKAKFYLADNYDLNYKELFFEIYSRDKIYESEFQGVEFGLTEEFKCKMQALKLEVREYDFFHDNEYYHYGITIVINMFFVTYDVRVNSITLKIAGQDYKFNTDIYFFMHNYRPIFIEPDVFAYTTGDSQKGPYCVQIKTRYDTTLKSLKFQTEGFDILSYYVEIFNSETGTTEVINELPVILEAKKSYSIFIDAIPPQDCLYYNYLLEVAVEINGIKMSYNNIEQTETILFLGSALNSI